MAKIGTITFEGCSGKIYIFGIYPIGTNFKAFGGVYYISEKKDENHTHIYLGITEDISSRFNDHHKQDCFDKNSANCISIYLVESKKDRKLIEKDILCNYNFICNEVNN